MNPLKGNFKQMYRNSPGGVFCVACGEEEEVNSHVMICGDYADLRQGKDLKNNIDLVNYFFVIETDEKNYFLIRINF